MNRKTINICGKDYEVSCNAYTRFLYKKMFGVGIMKDMKKLNDFSVKQNEIRKELEKDKKLSPEEIEQQVGMQILEDVDDLIDVILKIAYILIYTENNKVESFEDWLKGIESIDLGSPWVQEVTELAVDSFHG